MKKSFCILFLLSILTRSAFSSEDSDTGLAPILLDQTYQISKSSCMTRDPSNARITEEAWTKWEDDNKEGLAGIREMRLILDSKFEKMALEDESRSPLEKEEQPYAVWFKLRDLTLSQLRDNWSNLPENEVEKYCEYIRTELQNPPFQTTGQELLIKAREVFEGILNSSP